MAVAADGSLRDALSLLDQLLAFGGTSQVREADARAMLGTVDRQQVVQLARLLAAGDVDKLLDYARSLEQWSPDYLDLLDALTSLLARIALFQAAGRPYDEEDEVPAEVLAELAAAITPEDLQLYYQIGVLGRRDQPLVSDQAGAFALTLVRMLVFRPGAAGPSGAAPAGGNARVSAPRARSAPVARQADAPDAAEPAVELVPANWSAIVRQLGLSGLSAQLAAHCALLGRQGTQVRLLLDARGVSMRNRTSEEKLAAALGRYLGKTVKLAIEVGTEQTSASTPARERDQHADQRLAQARAMLESDPNVQVLRSEMGATIFPDSVRATINEE